MAKYILLRTRANQALKDRVTLYREREARRGNSKTESVVLREALTEFLDRVAPQVNSDDVSEGVRLAREIGNSALKRQPSKRRPTGSK